MRGDFRCGFGCEIEWGEVKVVSNAKLLPLLSSFKIYWNLI